MSSRPAQMPWYMAEAYMYRLMLQITRYDAVGSPFYSRDPFAPQKHEEMSKASTWTLIRSALAVSTSAALAPSAVLPQLMRVCIYGNKADLCYKVVGLESEIVHGFLPDSSMNPTFVCVCVCVCGSMDEWMGVRVWRPL